jgi:hypothetical protein
MVRFGFTSLFSLPPPSLSLSRTHARTLVSLVTAVGGTFGSKAGEEQLSTNSDQGLNIASGGGFSKVFTTANGFDLSFQTAAVESWRNQHDASMSLPGYTLPDGSVGRGFPDVSAKSDNIVVLIGGQLSVISGTRYEIINCFIYYISYII